MSSLLQLETRKTLPLDVSLLNDQDLNAIYINGDPAGQTLRLEVSNSTGEPIELLDAPQAGQPPFQLELVFRPGVLSDVLLDKLVVQEANVSLTKVKNDNGTVSLQLNIPPRTLAKGDKFTITLLHVIPDGRLGSRGTRVMLRYYNTRVHGATTVISGFRETHLSIVTHLGKQNIPLHVGVVGPAKILNNGTPNTLNLRVSNLSREYAIQTSTDPSRPASFFLSFDVGNANEEWALGTTGQVQGIQVQYAVGDSWLDATRIDAGQAQSPEWQIPVPTLAKRAFLDIKLGNVVTSHPSGTTNVLLRYDNVPGYWDGQFVAILEKSPLTYFGNQIGIGTTKAVDRLQIGDFSNADDTYLAVKTAGANRFKAGIRFRHFSEDYGYTLVSDETTNSLQIIAQHGPNMPVVPVLNIAEWTGPVYTVDIKAKSMKLSGGVSGAELILEADTDNTGSERPMITMKRHGGQTVGQLGFPDPGSTEFKLVNLATNTAVSLGSNGNAHVESGVVSFAVQGDGNVVIYRKSDGKPVWASGTNISDINLKTDLEPIQSPLERLTALQGISFRWKDGDIGKERELGLIAQEVEAVFPELMNTLGKGAKLVQYEKFVPVLIEALKEQQAMIEALQQDVERLANH